VPERLAGDAAALAVLACIEVSIARPAEQVAATGLTSEAVRNATKRIARCVLAIASEANEVRAEVRPAASPSMRRLHDE
jgi:hypothetical protein